NGYPPGALPEIRPDPMPGGIRRVLWPIARLNVPFRYRIRVHGWERVRDPSVFPGYLGALPVPEEPFALRHPPDEHGARVAVEGWIRGQAGTSSCSPPSPSPSGRRFVAVVFRNSCHIVRVAVHIPAVPVVRGSGFDLAVGRCLVPTSGSELCWRLRRTGRRGRCFPGGCADR